MIARVLHPNWEITALNEAHEATLQRSPSAWHVWQRQQWQQFQTNGIPTRHHENWKYTKLNALLQQEFNFNATEHTAELPKNWLLPNAHSIVFVNGHFSIQHSQLAHLPAGVELINRSVTQSNWEQFLNNTWPTTPFSELNGALNIDGVALKIPAQTLIADPIQILYITTELHTAVSHFPRHWIDIGANSNVTLLEEYRSLSTQIYFNNVATQINLAENATLTHYKLQREGNTASHIAHTALKQAANSHYVHYSFTHGGALSRDDLQTQLQGDSAKTQLFALYQAQAQQQLDHHTCIEHQASHCQSQQLYKSSATDRAHAIFNGKIIVHKNAIKTVAQQNNRNLLLSDQASIDAKPELEIYTDDVACTHGATIGSLDQAALFYFRSRGIPEATAKELLIDGFRNEILQQIGNVQLAEHIGRGK